LLENPLLWRDIDDLVRQSGVLPRAVVNAVIRELEKISGIDYGFSVAGQICCVSPLARTVEWQRSSRGGLLDPNRYVFFKNGKPSLASPLVQFIITDFPPQVLTAFAGEWASWMTPSAATVNNCSERPDFFARKTEDCCVIGTGTI